jgi:hypothetical protein
MKKFIYLRFRKYWGAGGGLWIVIMDREHDVPLVRPLSIFLQSKTWDVFESFSPVFLSFTVNADGSKTV